MKRNEKGVGSGGEIGSQFHTYSLGNMSRPSTFN